MIPKDKRDTNPQETQEWIESLEDELEEWGFERTRFLLETLIDYASNRALAYLLIQIRPLLTQFTPINSLILKETVLLKEK